MTAVRKHPLAECENCSLRAGKYVPTVEPEHAAIAVVGEAPGYTEADKGLPFVGASGKLLNTVLRHNGIKREDVVLTNAVLCHPENNETPSANDIRCCQPRLLSELCGTKTILAMGNSANESVLGESGVFRLRVGRGKTSKNLPGVRVVSTIHPAAVLRVPDSIIQFTTDVGKLKDIVEEWTPPLYTVADTEEDALSIFSQLLELNPERIAVDIETHVEKDESFEQPQHQLGGLLCIGIAYAYKRVIVIGENALNYRSVLQALKHFVNSRKEVGYHNGKFDVKGLYPHCDKLKFTSDTLIMSYCLNEHAGVHSLEYNGREILGAPDWKGILKPYKPKLNGYGVVPRPKLYQYNAYDCDITWCLEPVLRKRLEAQDLVKVHDFMVEVANELIYIEMNGIGIDRDYLEELSRILGVEIEEIREEITVLLPDKTKRYQPKSAKKHAPNLNPGSPQQVTQVLKDFGIGVSSTDEKTVKVILERKGVESPVGQFCTNLLRYRGKVKEKGTYVDGIRERLYDGRVHSSFLLHGTTSGRLSSRRPNLQNIPRRKKIKKLFIPTRPNHVFVQTDYSQAELRILSWLSGDTYFMPIFNEGIRDVFDELSSDLFPAVKKNEVTKEEWKDLRARKVKPFAYGLAYGRTEYGIAADPDLKLSVSEAKVIMKQFMGLIPEIVTWQEWVKHEVESGKDLISAFGRHRRFPFITNDNHDDTMREALSFLPSSTSSDLCLRAMCRVRRDTRGMAWVRNVIHDAILVECHESRVEEVTNIMESHMLESAYELVGDGIKFAVDTGVGNSWGDLED